MSRRLRRLLDTKSEATPCSAKVNDITAAQATPIEAGATYVFDLGDCDYGWWAKMDAAGCRVVTRFKSNTLLTVTAEQEVTEGASNILSDRKTPFSDLVREVCVRIATGKVPRILCNDLDAPAQEIADLYKRRWAIGLFFRWVKPEGDGQRGKLQPEPDTL